MSFFFGLGAGFLIGGGGGAIVFFIAVSFKVCGMFSPQRRGRNSQGAHKALRSRLRCPFSAAGPVGSAPVRLR